MSALRLSKSVPHSPIEGSFVNKTKYISQILYLPCSLHHVGVSGVHLTHLEIKFLPGAGAAHWCDARMFKTCNT